MGRGHCGGSGREIAKIVERYEDEREENKAHDEKAETSDVDGSDRTENLGRVLDTSK